MKNIIQLTLIIAITIGFVACDSQTKKSNAKNEQKTAPVSQEKPSDADFLAFMVFHHMNYMITTAKQAGGTNKLFHTRELPTEGTDGASFLQVV